MRRLGHKPEHKMLQLAPKMQVSVCVGECTYHRTFSKIKVYLQGTKNETLSVYKEKQNGN